MKVANMARRTKNSYGWVRFPVDTPSSNEGGVFVKLWVVEPDDVQYQVCCGGQVFDCVQEVFLGSDKDPPPPTPDLYTASLDEYKDHCNRLNEWKDKLFDPETGNTTVLASVLLGSTGWSSSNWLCTYDDLTEEGKSLYNSLAALYPEAELHIVTFLDT